MTFQGKRFQDREFDVHLAPFAPETLEVFLQIELPQAMTKPAFGLEAIVVPGLSIGEFYHSIQDDLKSLVAEAGSEFVFSGPPEHQVPEDFYWSAGGGIIQVKDLDSALAALELIIDQGEGAGGGLDDGDDSYFAEHSEVAHYFRFNEIKMGRRYAAGDRPANPPTGKPMAVDFTAVYPIKPDCKATDFAADPTLAELNDRFNRTYSLMLRQLEEGFNGNPKVLYTAIMNAMHGLSGQAVAIMQIPLPNDPQGRNAAPTFEWNDPPLP